MGFSTILFVWMVFIHLGSISVSSVILNNAYEGCWREPANDRFYTFNPGFYNPEIMTPLYCMSRCGSYNFKYAALYHGKSCFCGPDLPMTLAVVDTQCSTTCSGDTSQKCGGLSHVSVYATLERIEGLKVSSDIVGVSEAPATVTLTYSVDKGNSIMYQADYGDGAGPTGQNETGMGTRRLYLPGEYVVTVQAEDVDPRAPPVKSATAIILEAGPDEVETECDTPMLTYEEGTCIVTVWWGSNLNLQADIPGKSSSITVNPIADPQVELPGFWSSNPNGIVNDASTARIALLVGTAVRAAGKFFGWRVHVKSGGTVNFMIMRPTCTTGSYCPLTNTCSVSCASGPTCTLPNSFCMQKSACDGTCTPPTKSYGSGDIPVDGYETTEVLLGNFITVGEHLIPMTDPIDVMPGDIMALEQNGPGIVSVVDTSDISDITMAHPGSPAIGQTFNVGSGSALNARHLVQPYVSYGSKAVLKYTFTGTPGVFPLTVTVTNNNGFGTPAVNITQVTIVEGINVTIIEGPRIVTLGDSSLYYLAPHTGSGVTYNWNVSDGHVYVGANLAYTFPVIGQYNVSVEAVNAVSRKENVTEVIVQEAVQGVTIVSDNGISNLLHSVNITMTTGSNFTCHVQYGDGASQDTSSQGSFPHAYTARGSYTISVNCSNDVSSDTDSIVIHIQEPICHLKLERESASTASPFRVKWNVSSGSDIVFTLVFDGSTLPVDTGSSDSNALYWMSFPIGPLSANGYPYSLTASNALNTQTISGFFLVQEPPTGPTFRSDLNDVTTDDTVTFTVDMTSGPGMTVIVEFQDGSPNKTFTATPPGSPWPGPWVFTHDFINGCTCSVTASIFNPAASVVLTVNVLVKVGLSTLNMSLPGENYYLYEPPATLDAVYFSTAGALPTVPTITIDWGDNSPIEEVTTLYTNPPGYSWQYDDVETYYMSFAMVNPISSRVFRHKAIVVEKLVDPKLQFDFISAPLNQPYDVTFILYRGDQGNHTLIYWDFGDGNAVTVTERQGYGEDGSDTLPVTYTSLGTKTVTVTAIAPLNQSVSVTTTFEVIPGVDEAVAVVTVNGDVTLGTSTRFTLQYNFGTMPLNAFIRMDWYGDGSLISAPIPFTIASNGGTQDIVYTYLTDGLFNAKMIIYNDASRVFENVEAGIYQDFVNVQVEVTYKSDSDDPNAPRQNGLSNGGLNYPLDKTIYFKLTDDNNAFASSYDMRATSGPESVLVSSTENDFPYNFTEVGAYTMEITISNPLYSTVVTVSFEVVKRVQKLEVTQELPLLSPGQAKRLNVSLSSSGDDTCVYIDWDDMNLQHVYSNIPNTCSSSSYPYAYHAGTVEYLSSYMASHRYYREGRYTVTVEAMNAYGTQINKTEFPISHTACTSPEIMIHNQEKSIYYAPSFKRSSITRILGLANIECPQSYKNTKLWKLEEVDSKGDNVSEVDLTGIPATKAEIYIPALYLPLGNYKAIYSMTMIGGQGAPDLFTDETYTYFKVESSPLLASMLNGGLSEVTLGSSQTLLLEPLTWSMDPDMNSTYAQGLTVLSWTCEDVGAADNATCSQSIVQGAMTQSIEAFRLTLGSRYTFSAFLQKDTRTAVASVIIKVNGTVAPLSLIRCVEGSICYPRGDGFIGLESSKVSLECDCPTCSGNEIYEWRIFIKDYRWHEGWRPIRVPFLKENSITPSNNLCGSVIQCAEGVFSKEFSIKKSLYEQYGTKTNVIKAQCVTHDGSDEGRTSLNIYINESPQFGDCTITPSVETATVNNSKQWQVFCYNWRDEDGIKEFQVTSIFSEYETEKEITSHLTPSHGFLEKVALPVGPPNRDYYQDIYVTIRDMLNAATKIKIATVQVLPPSSDEFQAYLKSALKDGDSSFYKLFYEGDQRSICETASAVSLLMANDARKSRKDYAKKYNVPDNWLNTGYSPSDLDRPTAFYPPLAEESEEARFGYEGNRDVRSQLKSKMLEFAIDLPMDDIISIQQFSSMLAELTAVPTEISTSNQNLILETVVKLMDTLDDPVKMKNIPQEEIEKAMGNLMSSVGAVTNAAGIAGSYPTLEAIEATKQEPFWNIYDTSIQALGDETDLSGARNYDEALWLHTKNVYKKVAAAGSQIISERSARVMRKMTMCFQKFAIAGQTHESTGYRSKHFMTKNFASNIVNKEIKLAGSDASVTFPGSIADLFPNGNIQDEDVLTVQVIMSTNVANRYSSKAEEYLPQEVHTHYVSIDVYGQDGQKLDIERTNKPFVINIPNDPNAPRNPKNIIEPLITKLSRFQIHKTETRSAGTSLHLNFEVVPDVQYLVIVTFDEVPDPANDKVDFVFAMPPTVPPDPSLPKPYEILIDNNMTSDRIGEWYIGIVQRDTSYINSSVPTNPEIISRYPTNTGTFQSYNLTIRASGCFSYTVGDEDWSHEGCVVGEQSSDEFTSCICSHLTTFAGGLMVVPNTIDWGFVFANADFMSNPTLYTTEMMVAALFLLAFILARRKDKSDLIRRGLAPMIDNDPGDKYYYEVIVSTGMRPNSGTNSKIFFLMASVEEESPVRWLHDSKRDAFKRGMTNGFLMAVPKRMEPINYIRVWHDNSGEGKFKSWFLKYISIKDLQTNNKEVFMANRWLAVEEDDGQVERIIPLASKEELTNFSYQFGERSKKDLVDGHLWFSVVAKPPHSKFTCVERVACCLCLLFMTMLTNAMFYSFGEEDGSTYFEFGPFSMTVTQITTGFVSTLIVFPANFLLVFLFRKSQPRKCKENITEQNASESTATSNSFQMRPKSESSSQLSTIDGNAASDCTNKKKSLQLPWWCRIIAWILLVILTLGSAAMVTFYGISFKETTCRKWITSLIFSFFTSIFITQPVKVVLTAVFLSLIIKNPMSDEDEDKDDIDDTSPTGKSSAFLHPPGEGFPNVSKINYSQPSAKGLEKIRKTRVKEVKMWAVVREIILYLIFLSILMIISHRSQGSANFHYKNNMYRTFISSLDTKIHFDKVKNKNDFWLWAKTGLLNGLQAGTYYNNYPPLMLRTYINDKNSRILGHATLRQHRIYPGQCEIPSFFKGIIPECNEKYSMSIEESRTFDKGWKSFNSSVNGSYPEYLYSGSDILDGYPYWGYHAMYSGGGYVARLTGNKADILSLMERLEGEEWIDRYTRSVFVEFTVYNPQVNLFSVNTMLTEFDRSNGAKTSYRFEPAMLLPSADANNTFYIICEIIFLIFISVFLILELKKLYQLRSRYFLSFWNVVETCIIAFSTTAIVVYFYRLYETNKLTRQFKADRGNKYIKFQYVGYWNEILSYMVGIVLFLTTLKLLRLLRFNQRVSMLGNTLKNSSKQLFHFGIIATVVFLAFCQLFFLTFMNVDETFSSFVESIVTSTLMLMGKFNIYTMIMAEPVLTQIFVLMFVLSLTFIIVNMFVSILNDTFSDVRGNIRNQSNEYEIVDFMLQRFQHYTGFKFFAQTTSDAKSKTSADNGIDDCEEDVPPNATEDHFDPKYESNMMALPDRFQRLLFSLSNAYTEQANCPEFFNVRQADGIGDVQTGFNMPYTKEPYRAPLTSYGNDFKSGNRRGSFPVVDM